MKINHRVVSLFVSVIGFSGAAQSAVLPMKMPSFSLPSGLSASASLTPALSVKSVPLPILPSAPVLPAFPAPVQGPMSLPGAAVPLPLSLPSELSIHHEFPDNEIHLDWSFLDGDEGAAALVSNDRGPKPLTPKGAAAQLQFAAKAARKSPLVQVSADQLFDHSRPRQLVSLP
ncbi:MAG: hypothetical protein ACHQ51_13405 [Elusimicrobiota bacterium]